MSRENSVRSSLFGIILMLTVALSPLAGAQVNGVSATILTDWVDDGTFTSHVTDVGGATLTFNAGTVNKYFWRRVGSNMEIMINL